MVRITGKRGWVVAMVTTAVAGLAAATVYVVGGDPWDPTAETLPTPSLDTNTRVPAAGDCRVELLGWPADGPPENKLLVSPDGRYIVGQDSTTTDTVVWHDGEPTLFADLSGITAPEVVAVNSRGVLAGTGRSPDGDRKTHFAWSAASRQTRDLTAPSGSKVSRLVDVNDSGTVVDTTRELDDVPYYGSEILRWPGDDDTASIRSLETEDYPGVTVKALSNEGMLAGGEFNWTMEEAAGEGRFRPIVWDPNGKRTIVPGGASDSIAIDIAGGWVLVSGEDGDLRWNFAADGKADEFEGFQATTLDELGRAYGTIGNGEDAVPAIYDSEAKPLPVVDDVGVRGGQDGDYNSVTGASLDGSVLVGNWKGNPVKWTCGGS